MKFVAFLLVSSSILSLMSSPSFAMEEREDKKTPIQPARPSVTSSGSLSTTLSLEEYAEFKGEEITPLTLLKRYVLLGNFLGKHTKEERTTLCQDGLKLMLEKKDKEAKATLKRAALYGDPQAMLFLGNAYKETGKNDDEATNWYIASFQTHWEETGQHNLSKKWLTSLKTTRAQEFLKNVDSDYPIIGIEYIDRRVTKLYDSYYKNEFTDFSSQEEKVLRTAKLNIMLANVSEDKSKEERYKNRFLEALISSFEKGDMNTIYPQDIADRRILQLFVRIKTPVLLEEVARGLENNKINIQDLENTEAKRDLDRIKDLTCDKVRAYFLVKANTPNAITTLGDLCKQGNITPEDLQKIDSNNNLGIKFTNFLTNVQLATFLYAKGNTAKGFFNLAAMFYRNEISVEEFKNLELPSFIFLNQEKSLTNMDLVAYFWAAIKKESDNIYSEASKNLAVFLREKKITYQRLKKMKIPNLPQMRKSSRKAKKPAALTDLDLEVIYYARANIPTALDDIGLLLLENAITVKRLEEIGVLQLLEIQDPFSLPANQLAALLFVKANDELAWNRLGSMLSTKLITLEEIRKINGFNNILKISPNEFCTLAQLAASLFAKANIPESLHNLGAILINGEITIDELKKGDIFKILNVEELKPLSLLEMAAEFFKKSNTANAKGALAFLYLNGELEPQLDPKLRWEKGMQQLQLAGLAGFKFDPSLLVKKEDYDIFWRKEAQEEQQQSDEKPTVPLQDKGFSSAVSDAKQPSQVIQKNWKGTKSKEEKNKAKKEKLKKLIGELKTASLSQSQKSEQKEFEIEYFSPQIEEDFKQLLSDSKKAHELIQDILNEPWGTKGAGKPELLKKVKGYWSRRINGIDRLVYRVEPGKIIIHSCKGHYKK